MGAAKLAQPELRPASRSRRDGGDRGGPSEHPARPGGHVAEMQRRRVLAATLEVVSSRGAQSVTVASVAGRAGVSRKTFYELFEDREQCLYTAFQDAVLDACAATRQAGSRERSWPAAIRAGLGGLLSFLDAEPGKARLLIVEALSAGERTLEARRRVLAEGIAFVDRGSEQIDAGALPPPPLTAEGVVGAVFSVIYARLSDRDPRPLTELAAPLTALVLQPYLGSAAAREELSRPTAPGRRAAPQATANVFKELPIRLTYRTARVLGSVAASPGASNKQIAIASGIADAGQMSRLLSRLEGAGLVENARSHELRGGPKAWSLTDTGRRVTSVIGN
jgi:AcrR family transcriptional regulator